MVTDINKTITKRLPVSVCFINDKSCTRRFLFCRTPEEPFYHVYEEVDDCPEGVNDKIQNKQTIQYRHI